MKNSIKLAVFFLAISTALVSCKKTAEEATTSSAEETAEASVSATKFMADPTNSSIEWKGFKPTGSHNGTISVESGVFTVKDNVIESGTFLIDMSSIVVLDIPADKDGNANLVGHLSGPDFFDVEKYPSAAFDVTGFETKDGQAMLSGNLTMKEQKNNITIPVSMSMENDVLTLTSETFTIDRSKWNVQYGSKSFFDNLGDKFINDEIELKINVQAKK
ncbi:MAG: YceI family protein [bacterium]